jgi:ribosomal protein S6
MSTTEDRSGELQVYELGYLLLPSIPENKLSHVVDNLKEIIKKNGATEIDSENPFMHSLAYSMSKVVGASKYVVDEAYIGWIKFEAEASSVLDLKTEVEKQNEVLRSLLIKAPRETAFTFAQAREKAIAKDLPEVDSEVEVDSPAPVVEEVKEASDEPVVE